MPTTLPLNGLTKRRREIVEAALQLTADGGARHLTMKRLAAKVGVSEAALYRHFASKNDILDAIVRFFDADAERAFAENAGRGLAGIETFVKSRFQRVAEEPVLAKVLFSEELFMDAPERSETFRGMMCKHRAVLTQFFKEAKKNGELRADLSNDALFLLVFGPVRLLVKQWGLSEGSFNLVREGNALWKALMKTLR